MSAAVRRSLVLGLVLVLGACGSPSDPVTTVDASPAADAAIDTSAVDATVAFGDLAGMCGVLEAMELTGATPLIFHASMTFARAFQDPADRPLLTPGGQTIAATPNAGGSSAMSEVFAFEQLARCEAASLIKTETEIVYDTQGKITDILVEIDDLKIGVSVTRAVPYPHTTPYTVEAATSLIRRKLEDIQASTMNVSAGDRWTKQILSVLAFDDQAAGVVADVWAGLDPAVRADTVVLITVTHGDDLFIY